MADAPRILIAIDNRDFAEPLAHENTVVKKIRTSERGHSEEAAIGADVTQLEDDLRLAERDSFTIGVLRHFGLDHAEDRLDLRFIAKLREQFQEGDLLPVIHRFQNAVMVHE